MASSVQLLIKNPSGSGLPGSPDINGFHDMTEYLPWTSESNTLTVNQTWGRQGDTASIPLEDEHSVGSQNFWIEPMAKVTLLANPGTAYTETIFGGLATKPQFYFDAPTLTNWYLSCQDYTLLATDAVVNTSFSGISMDNALVDLVAQVNAQYSPGGPPRIVANLAANGGNVYPAPVVPFIALPYQTLTNAFQAIQKQASQSSQYGWTIQPNAAGLPELHFYNQFQAPPPNLLLTDKPGVYGEPTPTHPGGPPGNGNPYQFLGYLEQSSQFYYEFDATQMYNDVQVLGAAISQPMDPQGPPTQVWIADGYSTSFSLQEPILTQDSSATYIGIQANSGQWYLVSQQGPPPKGSVIMVWYSYQIPLLVHAQSASNIGQYGVVLSELVNDNQLVTVFEASQRAQADLIEYARVEERINFYTTEGMVGHMNCGDLFYGDFYSIPNSLNGYAPGLQDNFIVTTNTINLLTSGYLQYQTQAMRVSTS
jgi:hypothetical protein